LAGVALRRSPANNSCHLQKYSDIDIKQCVERSRYAAGERDVLAASHYLDPLVICFVGALPDTGGPQASKRAGRAINQ
jgi:hypothetical protein